MPTDDKYPELLRDLRDSLAQTLIGFGIDKALAEHCAHTAAEQVRENWGGQTVYINKGIEYDLTARDLEIYAHYNGRNRHEICQRYGISQAWLYKIVKAVRAREVAKRQSDLFGAPDPPARRNA